MRIAAVVPAYNEEARIGEVLRALLAAPELAEIVVVNDGSRDGTAAVARQFRTVRALDLPENRGKGAAMRCGALAARVAGNQTVRDCVRATRRRRENVATRASQHLRWRGTATACSLFTL